MRGKIKNNVLSFLTQEQIPYTALPSCRALFSTDAPLGGSWLQADLKKGSTCRQTSSPGFKPSHMPLKSCTFSSSKDIISESFCFNRSEQWKQTKYEPTVFIQCDALNKCPLTSHLLGLSLQLSLVIFCLTGNPFIFILLPVQPSGRKYKAD